VSDTLKQAGFGCRPLGAQARATEAEQQAKRLYVGGKMDFLALLDAQRTLASADDAVASSHARLTTDQVAIFLALCGGWE
jgi:outer membrane protein, multidrug efflux system